MGCRIRAMSQPVPAPAWSSFGPNPPFCASSSLMDRTGSCNLFRSSHVSALAGILASTGQQVMPEETPYPFFSLHPHPRHGSLAPSSLRGPFLPAQQGLGGPTFLSSSIEPTYKRSQKVANKRERLGQRSSVPLAAAPGSGPRESAVVSYADFTQTIRSPSFLDSLEMRYLGTDHVSTEWFPRSYRHRGGSPTMAYRRVEVLRRAMDFLFFFVRTLPPDVSCALQAL